MQASLHFIQRRVWREGPIQPDPVELFPPSLPQPLTASRAFKERQHFFQDVRPLNVSLFFLFYFPKHLTDENYCPSGIRLYVITGRRVQSSL